jgi:hypothetical protein
MVQEYITITEFRESLGAFCRDVRFGRKKLIVTYHKKPLMEVKKLQGGSPIQSGIDEQKESTLTNTRDHMSEFIDLIEEHGTVILVAHGRRLVRCVKVDAKP